MHMWMNKRNFLMKVSIIIFIISNSITLVILSHFVSENNMLRDELDQMYLEEKNETTQEDINWDIESWNNCLKKLNIFADAVFFGDSITFDSDFQDAFPSKEIVNLGLPGDDILELYRRVSQISLVHPKKIFLSGGINSLKVNNIDTVIEQYKQLITAIREQNPDAEIYVQSVLPISADQARSYVDNDTIIDFNTHLKAMAQECRVIFIDIHSAYYKNKELDAKATRDGVHLNSTDYDRWINIIAPYINE